jgi:dienelactone hydrolase
MIRISVVFLSAALLPIMADSSRDVRVRIRSTLFAADPLPPLDVERYGEFKPEPGIVAERISYRTHYGLRVPAILYRPAKVEGKVPGLVVVNGHGGDKFAWYAFYAGVMYARAGAAVLTYDPIGEGERHIEMKSGTRAHDVRQEPAELGRRMGGLMMTDVQQAVSYLAQRPEVDKARLGAMGYSMGSFVLSLACAVETRLKACVLVGGGNLDGPGEYWDTSKPMCQGLPYQALSFLGDRAARIYALHAERGPTLVFNGTEDNILQGERRDPFRHFEDLRGRVIKLRGSAKDVFETGYDQRVGHRPFFVTRPVALWLEKTLDLPAWTAKQMEQMGTTHIGTWAKQHGIEMDRLYATEHREAGAQGLGEHMPGFKRDQLRALPEAEWQRRKSEMIYETWLERARAAMR